MESIEKAESEMQNVKSKEFENALIPVVMQCNDVLRHIATLHLSLVYPRLLGLSVASPGVGVSSAECRWPKGRGGPRGRVLGVRSPAPEMTCGFLIQLGRVVESLIKLTQG